MPNKMSGLLSFGLPKTETLCCAVCNSDAKKYLQKDGYTYYRCLRCKLIFLPHAPSAEQLVAFYGEQYFQAPRKMVGAYRCTYDDYAKTPVFKTPFYRFLLRQIRQLGANTVLDVGAAYGGFVEFLNHSGLVAEGIEISPFAAATARSLGNTVHTGSLEFHAEKMDWKNRFDAICLLDVFEHLHDYHKAMNGLQTLLKNDGALLIVTPSTKSISAKILGRKWYQLLPPQHTRLFHHENITVFLAQYGFQVIRIEYVKKNFSVKYFLHIFSGWSGIQLPNFLRRWFGNILFTFPLRDNMMIIAKKYE